MVTNERELALRAHIRTLLLEYALTHLTVNYVEYTEDFVSQILLPALHILPTSDPTLPILEPNLYDQINLSLKLGNVLPYHEKWSADAHSLSLMKQVFTVNRRSNDLPTWTCWREEAYSFIERNLSPVLSRRARKETPRLGFNSVSRHTSSSLVDLTDKHHLSNIPNEALEEQPEQSLNDVLGNRITLDMTTHAEMHSLLKSTLAPTTNTSTNSTVSIHDVYCESFIRSTSPPISLPEPLSPPIFSRKSMFGTGAGAHNTRDRRFGTLESVKSMILPKLEDDPQSAADRYMQDMYVVDGWHTLPIPSSPTPSLEEDQLDPQWLSSSSSPIRQPVIEMMDEYELPRTERIGCGDKKPDLPGTGERLNGFLHFLQPVPSTPDGHMRADVKVVTPPHSQVSSPHTSITAPLSMLGQPPTVFAELECGEAHVDYAGADELTTPISDDRSGLRAIMKLVDCKEGYTAKRDFDASVFILRERLDEKETMLMDVPELPSPNIHSSTGPAIPTTLSALRAEHGDGAAVVPSSLLGFLKKIKGFQSLNMELSWRPFHFGNSAPTHEEVARLTDNVRQDCVADITCEEALSTENVESALDSLLVIANPESTSSVESHASEMLRDEDTHATIALKGESNAVVILTAAERRRLYGLPEPIYDYTDSVNEQPQITDQESVARTRKRFKGSLLPAGCKDASLDGLASFDDQDFSTSHADAVDGSGNYLAELTILEDSESRMSYLDLAGSACGFDGPDDNLDELFADVDPIHFDTGIPSPTAVGGFGDCINPALLGKRPPVEPALLPIRDTSRLPHVEEVAGHSEHCIPVSLQQQQEPSLSVIPAVDHMLPVIEPSGSSSRCLNAGSAKQSLQEFMELRARTSIIPADLAVPSGDSITSVDIAQPSSGHVSFQVPKELIDHTTLPAPEHAAQHNSWHRYLGSLEFIQKLAITRALNAPVCKVQLVERESLNDADIIIDPHTAVIIFSLRSLPTQCDALVARINQLSWRFSRILVVFETVSFSDINTTKNSLAINPFSPAVVKAVKKVRRDVEIAEACLDKQEAARVQFAFPMSVPAAAAMIRRYGDMSYEEDTSNGLLWDDRHWLDADYEDPDERDLAVFDGMNVFAAAVILARNNLDEFLDKLPDQRTGEFGALIGHDRINAFNRLVARRIEAMQLPSSSPPTTSIDASNPLTPPVASVLEPSHGYALHC